MKRMRFWPLALLLGVVMLSCNKDKREWAQFDGFTLDDIKGTYAYSNVSGAFEGLIESEYCHICEDAQVSILPYLNSDASIEFKVNCPSNGLNKSFTGRPVLDDNASVVRMTLPSTSPYPNYEVNAYVYKNEKGETRLHGFARHIYYEIDIQDGETFYKVKSMVNYYFDVVKE